jgi:glycosyltransferase involved in cell wall biosynthesis
MFAGELPMRAILEGAYHSCVSLSPEVWGRQVPAADPLLPLECNKSAEGDHQVTKPRIYLAIATFHPQVGGAEKQALLQGRALRSKGYDATVITLRHHRAWPPNDVVEGVPVARVGGALLGDRQRLPTPLRRVAYVLGVLTMGWALWRRRQSYDLVHLYRLSELVLPVTFVCWLIGKPLLVGLRCANSGQQVDLRSSYRKQDRSSRSSRLSRTGALQRLPDEWQDGSRGDLESLEQLGKPVVRLTRYLLQRAGADMVVLSAQMKTDLAAYGFPTAGVWVIPNGIDADQFHPLARETPPIQQARVVLYAGRLVYQKGVDVLLRAWSQVVKELPADAQTRLVIAGEGPRQAQLRQLAQTLGIAEGVEFVGLQRDIVAWLDQSDLVVLPSRWEGMPNAVLEAMACGLPCVATRVSGSEDVIQNGVNGLLVEPEDHQALAGAILSLLRDPALGRRYGRAARATIEEHYSIDRITEIYLELYQKVWSGDWRTAPLLASGASRGPNAGRILNAP